MPTTTEKQQVEARMRQVGELADGRPLYYADETFTNPGYYTWDYEAKTHRPVEVEVKTMVSGGPGDPLKKLIGWVESEIAMARKYHARCGLATYDRGYQYGRLEAFQGLLPRLRHLTQPSSES